MEWFSAVPGLDPGLDPGLETDSSKDCDSQRRKLDQPGSKTGRKSRSRPGPGPSCESLKSDQSKDEMIDFKRWKLDQLGSRSRPGPGPICESLKSDKSKDFLIYFKSPGPCPSCESLKSDWSKHLIIDFKRHSEAPAPALSCGSRQSDCSTDWSLGFKETPSEHTEAEWSLEHLGVDPLLHVFMRLEEQVLSFVKEQLKRFHRVLASDYPECFESEEEEQSSTEAVLTIALDFLKRMNQEEVAQRLFSKRESLSGVCRDELKRRLQQRFSCVSEGVAKAGSPALLNQIYTELYITEGGAAGVNQEHEVRHIQAKSRRPAAPENSITCEDMFKGPAHKQGPIRAELPERPGPIRAEFPRRPGPVREDFPDKPIRLVLTKGVAGVGKTVLCQKLSLDWAEGRAHQDVQLLFPFTFRELNVLRERHFSLVGLLHHFYSEAKRLSSFKQLQVLFIFDGLDESRLPLDFSQTRVLSDPTESVSLDVLLVNLIRGSLLPSARLWITTRPAAANQIPAECISRVTEVRGFTDLQKEQYFRNRFRDEGQATAVISHIQTSRSLYIMCHLPVFSWMISTVLDHVMKTGVTEQLPHTLTQMYIHFLVVQAKVKILKYDRGCESDPPWTPDTTAMVQSLGKLAFEQLQKGNLIFYDSDLEECGLEAAGASVYSGVFTQVFREEQGLYQDKVYCFIHLSVQEFLAALHVHLTFYNRGVNLMPPWEPEVWFDLSEEDRSPELDFYASAVEAALTSPNGHLDLFLRFLLGLSLPTNQSLLLGLQDQTRSSSQTNDATAKHIKLRLNADYISAESRMNLLHCLNELNDRRLLEQVQRDMREGRLSGTHMSRADWSAVSFLLLSSDSELEEFDLRKYHTSEEAFYGLLPVMKVSTKLILSGCHLSYKHCDALASVLSSSSLIHLDLSDNDLQDSGVKQLCSGLKSAPSRLEVLRLSGCLLSERGGAALASALSSAHSHLRELDLRYNHPGPSVELLTALQDHCPLETLRLDPAGEHWMVPGLQKYFCEFSLDPNSVNNKLLLSEDNRTVTRVKHLQLYPSHQDRFSSCAQVLGSTGLTGRCYLEMKYRGDVDIALSYRGIRRRGDADDCRFGDNDQSWSLRSKGGQCSVYHCKRETSCRYFMSNRVGVFVDSEAGALSFYEVYNDKLLHLHTFSCSFSEPLFVGFGLVAPGSSVTLVEWDDVKIKKCNV